MVNQIRICISGDVGSGKSSVTRELKSQLNIKSYSTGDFQRKLAKQKNITTLELNQYSENHPEIDFEIDQMSKDLSSGTESFILDSRLGWHFVEYSFKIFITLNDEIAANRIIGSNRDNEQYSDLATAITSVAERKKSERNRYLKLYQVDLRDFSNYDLVIDSSNHSVEEITAAILESFTAWQQGKSFQSQLFFSV